MHDLVCDGVLYVPACMCCTLVHSCVHGSKEDVVPLWRGDAPVTVSLHPDMNTVMGMFAAPRAVTTCPLVPRPSGEEAPITVSPNGILTDVLKEVQTQMVSFYVTTIDKDQLS